MRLGSEQRLALHRSLGLRSPRIVTPITLALVELCKALSIFGPPMPSFPTARGFGRLDQNAMFHQRPI